MCRKLWSYFVAKKLGDSLRGDCKGLSLWFGVEVVNSVFFLVQHVFHLMRWISAPLNAETYVMQCELRKYPNVSRNIDMHV